MFAADHVFDANFISCLPFQSKDCLGQGWTVGSIIPWQTGAPISILWQCSTLNRRGRSGQNTVNTSLAKPQPDEIVRFRMTDDGPFYVPESAINPRDNSGESIDGLEPFTGQVFFQPGPGESSILQPRIFSGPTALAIDLSVSKSIQITERHALQARARIENILDHPTFFAGSRAISSTQFGRITSTLTGPRRIELFQIRVLPSARM